MPRLRIEERLEWRRWVTPRPLYEKPIHRWYVFPHSFTSELVHGLIDEWGLGPRDHILDPFVGAGTTILAAKEQGIPATGYDISPLAVTATRAKIQNYRLDRLLGLWRVLHKRVNRVSPNGLVREYADLVLHAFPGKTLSTLEGIDLRIDALDAKRSEKQFFRLALLSIMPHVSRAVATGGWLKWVDRRATPTTVLRAFDERVELMLSDLCDLPRCRKGRWRADVQDVRCLPEHGPTYTAVITSPPYPNRHDYTRVFGVELMFGFLDWDGTRRLRYQSFESHPEAHPLRPDVNGYRRPRALAEALARIRETATDERIPKMLDGYFVDLYLTLQELRRVTKRGGRIALVLGNAQYGGVPLPVDEICARIGQHAGLNLGRIIVTRYRGNSAQQMGRWGRRPSRESVVVLRAD